MLKKLLSLLAGRRCHRLFLLAGAAAALWGLKGLAESAVFVHEAVRVPAVVTDVTQKPFESTLDALRGGNWKAEVAYYPHVSYSIPGGRGQSGWRLPDADSEDHAIGEQLELLTMPNDPTTARHAAWKFIWGEPTVLFCCGVVLFLFGQLLRGRKGGKRSPHPAKQEPRRDSKPAPKAAQPAARPSSKKKGQMELGLDMEPAPEKPKRKRRSGASSTPRKRKKKEA